MSEHPPPLKHPKKIWFGSDFHYERFGKNYGLVELKDDLPADAPYDYLVIVGDLNWSCYIPETLAAIYRRAKVPIFYTPGNHEFWDGVKRRVNFDQQLEEMREGCERLEGVTFLYNEGVDIPDTNHSLFMSPLFTNLRGYEEYDFDEGGNPTPVPPSRIQECIGDYHRTLVEGRLLTAKDHIRLNKEAVNALGRWLEVDVLSKGRIPIIGTHFGPSKMSAHKNFPERDLVSAYFNTDYLDSPSYIWPSGSTWIHGHTHCNLDYMHPSGIRVVTNQFGYKGEDETNQSYDYLKHIEVK